MRRLDNGDHGRELNGTDKAMIVALSKSKANQDKAMSARKIIFADLEATAHMVNDATVQVVN